MIENLDIYYIKTISFEILYIPKQYKACDASYMLQLKGAIPSLHKKSTEIIIDEMHSSKRNAKGKEE